MSFRGIKRIDAKRFFAILVMKRDAKTLLLIMYEFIHLQVIIMSHEWSAYNNINKLEQGYEH